MCVHHWSSTYVWICVLLNEKAMRVHSNEKWHVPRYVIAMTEGYDIILWRLDLNISPLYINKISQRFLNYNQLRALLNLHKDYLKIVSDHYILVACTIGLTAIYSAQQNTQFYKKHGQRSLSLVLVQYTICMCVPIRLRTPMWLVNLVQYFS